MTFEELPQEVKDLVRSTQEPRVYFRPPKVLAPQRYVIMNQIEATGPLTRYNILQPPPAWLNTPRPDTRLPAPFGNGHGFSEWPDRIILDDTTGAADRPTPRGDFPIRGDLEFYEYTTFSFYVASERVLGILKGLGAATAGMAAPLFHQTEGRVERIPWWFVDFPPAPVVDYARSSAEWVIIKVNDRVAYQPIAFRSEGGLAVHDADFGPIVRDNVNSNLVLTRHDVLAALRAADVAGPDYRKISAD